MFSHQRRALRPLEDAPTWGCRWPCPRRWNKGSQTPPSPFFRIFSVIWAPQSDIRGGVASGPRQFGIQGKVLSICRAGNEQEEGSQLIARNLMQTMRKVFSLFSRSVGHHREADPDDQVRLISGRKRPWRCDLTKYALDYNTLTTSPTTQGHHREAGSWTLNNLSPYPIHSLLLQTTSSDCSVSDRITEDPPVTPSFTGGQHQKIYRYSPYILKVYWCYFTSIATISAQIFTQYKHNFSPISASKEQHI